MKEEAEGAEGHSRRGRTNERNVGPSPTASSGTSVSTVKQPPACVHREHEGEPGGPLFGGNVLEEGAEQETDSEPALP